ncbi:MAG TPA: isoprenylcysteine carboxylmethyltransferase family protein [Terriglobales bacterium]|nr:isoprenylcysteine carboxylmethyltransferase family protein [Terriglobales bacterium]
MVYLKLLLFTVLVPGTVAVYVPWRLASGRPADFDLGPLRYLGLLLMAVGAAFYFRCAFDFAGKGKGTPAPIDAPKFLVTSNLYQMVRNPMYVGVITLVVGEGVMYQSFPVLRYAALVWLAFHLFVLLYEEPTLRDKFGADYEEYCRRVPRWIPKLRRR